jgi:hypothetical protein
MKIYVKVKPNSSEQKIVRFGDFRFLVYVKSPPENDKANIEMINLLSKHLGVPPKSLQITFGRTSNDKILEIKH